MSRTVEIFTAGCGACTSLLDTVTSVSCSSCDIIVHDMKDPNVAARARDLGVAAVPAVIVDGTPVQRNASGGYDEQVLRAAGIGSPA